MLNHTPINRIATLHSLRNSKSITQNTEEVSPGQFDRPALFSTPNRPMGGIKNVSL
jgi:hypothetical protein